MHLKIWVLLVPWFSLYSSNFGFWVFLSREIDFVYHLIVWIVRFRGNSLFHLGTSWNSLRQGFQFLRRLLMLMAPYFQTSIDSGIVGFRGRQLFGFDSLNSKSLLIPWSVVIWFGLLSYRSFTVFGLHDFGFRLDWVQLYFYKHLAVDLINCPKNSFLVKMFYHFAINSVYSNTLEFFVLLNLVMKRFLSKDFHEDFNRKKN